MTNYEIYVFILCLFVFILLTSLSVFTVVTITKLTIRLIRYGDQDEYILKLFEKEKREKLIYSIFSLILSLIMLIAFFVSTVINRSQDNFAEGTPTYRVISSGSMSRKHSQNDYLFDNNINDQLETFDLAKFNAVSSEEDLDIYDIVVYKYEDVLVCHRIIDITEREGDKQYILQGDANQFPDSAPVLPSQIVAIYSGEKIPAVGSFILFLQSPSGWLCIFLVAFSMIATPIAERKLENERRKRYLLLAKQNEQDEQDEYCEVNN